MIIKSGVRAEGSRGCLSETATAAPILKTQHVTIFLQLIVATMERLLFLMLACSISV